MNVLILAAGGQVASVAHGDYPLWLAEAHGTTILERQVRSFERLTPSRFVFAFNQSDVRAYHVGEIAELLSPGCGVVEIAGNTQGAACTALLAIEEVDHERELIITAPSDIVDVDFLQVIDSFRGRGADAGMLTFESIHPRYSFVRTDADGNVLEAAEKRPISRNAIAGVYWFARAGDFFDAVQRMILKDAAVNGAFFISPAINELLLQGKRVVSYPVRPEQYHPIKAPHHVDVFEHALERTEA